MSADDYIRQYIAAKLEIPRHMIAGFKFRADEGRAYSTLTVEDFECVIDVDIVNGEDRFLFLDSTETAAFLNGFASAVKA